MAWRLSLVLLLACAERSVQALDNGLAITPPRGWRSWNFYGDDINQAHMEAAAEALASRSRKVGGVPTSLADLGFVGVGVDDGWQLCDSGPGGTGFHNGTGYPLVNGSRFPDN